MARLARSEGRARGGARRPLAQASGSRWMRCSAPAPPGAPRPPMAALLDRMLDLELPIVAVDGPTGVDLQSGIVHGAPRAELTVTFGGLRRGHLLARDEVGDAGRGGHRPSRRPIPAGRRWSPTSQAAGVAAPTRSRDHKGARGRVVIVGGDAGMTGAVAHGGPGRVRARARGWSTSWRRRTRWRRWCRRSPISRPWRSGSTGRRPRALLDLVGRADALVIGPGLGRAPGRRELVARSSARPRAVGARCGCAGRLPGRGRRACARWPRERPVVLTPAPGRVPHVCFPTLAAERELDPWAAAARRRSESAPRVLLKGVPTVVARAGRPPLTVAAGNPGLATGGSGDVLSGLVGTALAQGLAPDVGRGAGGAGPRPSGRPRGPPGVGARAAAHGRGRRAARPLARMGRLSPRAAAPRPPMLLELTRPQTL